MQVEQHLSSSTNGVLHAYNSSIIHDMQVFYTVSQVTWTINAIRRPTYWSSVLMILMAASPLKLNADKTEVLPVRTQNNFTTLSPSSPSLNICFCRLTVHPTSGGVQILRDLQHYATSFDRLCENPPVCLLVVFC